MTNRLKYHPEGLLQNTRENTELLASPAGLDRAMREKVICEADCVMCDHGLRLHVALGSMDGIIPREEAVYQPGGGEVKDIAIITRVGRPVCFMITGFGEEEGRPVAYLSRRLAQRACMEDFVSRLSPGDIVPAVVTHLESFGAFVDIGCGISSLLSVDCISVSRISHPGDRLTCGMKLYVVIKSIDPVLHRVFVSLRELLGTWEQNARHFAPGQTVTGVVRSVESYGVFVELAPNLAGLAELREDTGAKMDLTVGRSAAVYIKSILPERMKIKLVLIDTYPAGRKASEPVYYIDPAKTEHLSGWRYSPSSCGKVTETLFDL